MTNRASAPRHVVLCTSDPDVLAAVELLGPAGFMTTRCTTLEQVEQTVDGSVLGIVLDAELPHARAREIYEHVGRLQAVRRGPPAVLLIRPPEPARATWEPTPDRRQWEDCAQKPITPTELALRLQALLVRTGRLDPGDVWVGLARAPSSGMDVQLEKGKVLAFFSAQGGVGKTTLAVHVAVGLQQLGTARVAFIDGDLWSGAAQVHLNVEPKRSIYDATLDGTPTDSEIWLRILAGHPSGLKFLASPQRLEEVEHVPDDAVAAAAQALAKRFDYVIIDLGSVPSESALAALDTAEHVLVVATPEMAVLRSTQRLVQVGVQLGFSARVRFVLNRADHGLAMDQVRSVLPLRVEATVPSDGRRFVAAANHGTTLFDQAMHTPAGTRRALEGLVRLVADSSHLEAVTRDVPQGTRKMSTWLPKRGAAIEAVAP